jgi:hypothetical protein
MSTKEKERNIDIQLKKKNIPKDKSIDVIIAPTNEGRMTPVRNKMLEIIADSDDQLQPQITHVRPDWKVAVYYLENNYPVVTLRLGNVDITELIYGRQISETRRGHFVTYKFSAHVWAEKSYQLFDEGANETQAQAKPASELADKIMDVFLLYTGDETSGIWYFDKLTARESEPERGPQRLTRIIIEGVVLAKRPLVMVS